MRDIFIEIWESIRRNKLRTVLTGFAVSWGIFMLIVLLGAGNGIMNAFSQGSGDILSNTMMVGGGWTSKPYDGLKQGRRIRLDDRDVAISGGKLFNDVIDDVVPTVSQSGMTVTLGKLYLTSMDIEGTFPKTQQEYKIVMYAGRYINDLDIDQRRKVVVLSHDQAEHLLGGSKNYDLIVGQRVKIGSFSYLVAGVYKGDEMEMRNSVYMPYTTLKTVFGKGDEIDHLTFTFHGLETEKENEAFEKRYKSVINMAHRAAPDDERAMWIWNRFTQNLQMNKGSRILNIALWVIGLFTLLGGIVGVSNIMLITVKERTHEFGIRKSLGARPGNILSLILAESVSITAVFGYVGMVLGILACELLDKTLGQSKVDLFGSKVAMLVNPTVGIDIAIGATVVLIVAGTIAGLMPAMKAAKVKPIEALRAE